MALVSCPTSWGNVRHHPILPNRLQLGMKHHRKLLFVVNIDWFFLSHRLPIALEAMKEGYEVHLATSLTNCLEVLRSHGLIVHPLTLERGSTGIFATLQTMREIFTVFRNVQPDIAHLVTIKPVVLGGIVLHLLRRKPAIVAAISGLGFVFVDKGLKAWLRRLIVGGMYALALNHKNIMVIFQNKDDQKSILKLVQLKTDQITEIKGSGVNLEVYRFTPLPTDIPKVILASRLLRDKGVWEFVAAARLLKTAQYAPKNGVRCILVGDLDPENPASLSKQDLVQLQLEGVVEVWGHRKDMAVVLSSAHIVALPSYREGFPKILIEAAACGRAVVTSDVPGCRDSIEPGVTGVLVPVGQVEPLAQAIRDLLDDPIRCARMGVAGRMLAERAFDITTVVQTHLQIYEAIINKEIR